MLACSLRSRVVGFETVIAEACGKQACGTPPNGIGAASVGGGNEDGAFFGSGGDEPFQFRGLNQRNVSRDYESAVDTAGFAEASRGFDCIGFSTVGVVGDHGEMELQGQLYGEWVACNDSNFRTLTPSGHSLEHVEQHGLRQFSARGLMSIAARRVLRRRDF